MDPLASLGALDDPSDAALALDDPLGALALALMSRLRTTRAVGALGTGAQLRVECVKGLVPLRPGDVLPFEGDGMPPALAEAGLALAVPLRYAGEPLGVLALGPRIDGRPFAAPEIALARSLASATAASLAARQSARELSVAHRALAARAHALRTLFESAQAFGRLFDRTAIADRLALVLMGQLLVRRVAVALCDAPDGPLETVLVRGASQAPVVPRDLARQAAPVRLVGPLAEAGWCWSMPLRAGEASRGAVLLGPCGTSDALDADFALALGALAVGALETADRVDERVERERLREEVRLAREVQARLLPEHLPELPGLEVAARWRPSRDVSGDTYDAVDLGRGRLLVAVADVVGKGIGASLLMATVQAGFRLVQPDLEAAADPASALQAATARLDRLVRDSTESHQFVTLAWALVEPEGQVTAVVAGHPPPLIRRASGAVETPLCGSPLLGVLPDPSFLASTAHLHRGDALLLYTDGATEAQDAEGAEFGPERLRQRLALSPQGPAAAVAAHVEQTVDAWAADASAEADDLTLLVVRRA